MSDLRSDTVRGSVQLVLYLENVELSIDREDALAESAIVHAAIKLGVRVFKPLSDGERYDLILNLRPRLLRVHRTRRYT